VGVRLARHPARMFWLLSLDGEPVGMAAYDVRPGEEVEIETFGLLPEFTGKNLGGYALTLTIERAWRLAPSVRRVWLHTSSLDHPHALPNYHRRDFTHTRPRSASAADQRCRPFAWRRAAGVNIPLDGQPYPQTDEDASRGDVHAAAGGGPAAQPAADPPGEHPTAPSTTNSSAMRMANCSHTWGEEGAAP
jgi:hypothetical protein